MMFIIDRMGILGAGMLLAVVVLAWWVVIIKQ